MGIYWPLEEQRLAAGGEVLLERWPAAGRGCRTGQREWRLAEEWGRGFAFEKAVRDIFKRMQLH